MKEEIVAFINDMIDALTWQRVGVFLVFTVVLVLMLVFYENRSIIITSLFSRPALEEMQKPWELSENSKQELKKLTNQPLVAGVLVTEVNLKKNRRITKFWYVRDPVFRDTAAKIFATLLPQPFFDSDHKNNAQMLDVLSNKFVCSKTTDTVFHRILPTMYQTMPVVCRLSVPPYVGDFAGFITIALIREPSYQETETLKIEISRISINMYIDDIRKNGG